MYVCYLSRCNIPVCYNGQCVITVSVSSRSVGDENVVGRVSVRHLELFVVA